MLTTFCHCAAWSFFPCLLTAFCLLFLDLSFPAAIVFLYCFSFPACCFLPATIPVYFRPAVFLSLVYLAILIPCYPSFLLSFFPCLSCYPSFLPGILPIPLHHFPQHNHNQTQPHNERNTTNTTNTTQHNHNNHIQP